MKQAYLDFWGSMEYILVQMATGNYRFQSYTGAFARVLTLGKLLSLPQSHDRLVWIGSEATLAQCAAIDHNANAACAFSYPFAQGYLSQLTVMPGTDFILIALSEFLGSPLVISREELYRNKLTAYVGDNQNAVQCAKYRRPKNRISQYFRRVLNRMEVDFGFTVFPCYINSPHNEICDNLSRVDSI